MVAGVVIRIAHKQDRVSGLVWSKKRKSFMQSVPQRHALSQRGSAFNYFIDSGSAHLRLRRESFCEGGLFSKDSEGHRLAFWRLTRLLCHDGHKVSEFIILGRALGLQ